MVNKEHTCLVVLSKDCYSETRQLCIEALYKFGFCHKYDVYVSSEKDNLSDHHYLFNIKTGDGIWSERLKFVLNNTLVGYKNVIFMLEDMIIKNVDMATLFKVVDFHNIVNADLTKLGNHPFFTTSYTDIDINGYKVCSQLRGNYLISHQPVGIWKLEFLKQTLDGSFTPWEHETVVNDKLNAGVYGKKKIYTVGSYPAIDKRVGDDYGEIIEYHHELSKGEKIPYIGKYK